MLKTLDKHQTSTVSSTDCSSLTRTSTKSNFGLLGLLLLGAGIATISSSILAESNENTPRLERKILSKTPVNAGGYLYQILYDGVVLTLGPYDIRNNELYGPFYHQVSLDTKPMSITNDLWYVMHYYYRGAHEPLAPENITLFNNLMNLIRVDLGLTPKVETININ